MVSQTLTEQEISKVQFVHTQCDVLSTTVARLYDGRSGRWEFTGVVGAVSVLTQRVQKVNYIKIIDLQTTKCVFEQELYENFDYQKQRDFFYTFDGDSQVFGLSFADVGEAAEFHTHVLNIKSGNRPNNASASNTAAKLSTRESSSSNLKAEKKKNKGGGFMSKFFGGNAEPELEISAPTGFQHKSHIGWDPEKGFDIRDIPADWKKLFQNAGIKKSELKDAATAQYIVTVIGEQMAAQSGSGATAPSQPNRTVPPPPPTQRAQPPPPPPTKGAPPPPPPTKGTPPPPPPHSGGPPPPPPMTGGGGPPPPPPPPPMGAPPPPPPPSFSASGGGGGGGGGRADLLASIREGKNLKSVEENPLPDLKDLSNEGNRSLVDTLAAAMAARRGNMREDEEEADDEDDEDWSDY